MKRVISIINPGDGQGKTTLALHLAAVLRSHSGVRPAVLELNDLSFGSGAGTGKDHTFEEGRTDYFCKRYGFELLWSDDARRPAQRGLENADVLLIDAGNGIGRGLADISDCVIVPTTMEREDICRAKKVIEHFAGKKYPAGLFRVVVTRSHDGILRPDDIQGIFGSVRVASLLPEKKGLSRESAFAQSWQPGARDRFVAGLCSLAGELLALECRGDKGGVFAGQEACGAGPGTAVIAAAADDGLSGVRVRTHKTLIAEMDIAAMEKDALSHPEKKAAMQAVILRKIREILDRDNREITDRTQREKLVTEINDEVTGLGAIEELVRDPAITEIMVNGPARIYAEKAGRLYLTGRRFTGDDAVLRAIERIVLPLGRRIDESMPYVDARLADGSRVNAVIPPLSLDGPSLTIRKFPERKLTAQDMITCGTLTGEAAQYLREAVAGRKNVLISGGTGSGKTTLLNVLSSFIPEDERIITVEDSAELKLSQEHVVRLESRPPNIEGRGAVTIRDLVKNCLRMRPDRIVVGECRGGEAFDMLQAMNTGHDGSMTTVHANSPRDALARVEVMVLMAGMDLPARAVREQIKSAVNIVIQQARLKDGARKVTHISEVTGMEGERILMHDVFRVESGVLARVDRLI